MDAAPKHSNPLGGEPAGGRRAAILAQNVKRLRTKSRINKKTFALMVGIGRPFLDKIESGEANPRLSVLEKLADALETTPERLLTSQVDEERPAPRITGSASEARHARLP